MSPVVVIPAAVTAMVMIAPVVTRIAPIMPVAAPVMIVVVFVVLARKNGSTGTTQPTADHRTGLAAHRAANRRPDRATETAAQRIIEGAACHGCGTAARHRQSHDPRNDFRAAHVGHLSF